MRTLALTLDGDLTYCSVDEASRGTNGCNHIGHENKGESTKDFIVRMENLNPADSESAYAVYSLREKRQKVVNNISMSFSPITSESGIDAPTASSINDLDEGGVTMELSAPVMNDSSKSFYSQQWGISKKSLESVVTGQGGMVFRVSTEGSGYRVGQVLSADQVTDLRTKYSQQEVSIASGMSEFSDACREWNIDEPSNKVYVLTNEERRSSNDYPNDIHQLYRRLWRADAAHKKNQTQATADKLQLAYRQLLDNENMKDEGFRANGYHLKGISSLLNGKSGLIRHEMTGGIVRYSGRAVITPDETLQYNEARIPMKLAVTMYEPLLRDRLMNEEGMSREEVARYLAHLRWANYESIDQNDKDFVNRTLEESDLRCLLGRQPSLHRASLQAFKPSLSPDNTIKISPSIVAGYNADFDGDTMMAIAVNDVDISQNALKSAHAENLTQQPAHQESTLVKPTKDAKLGIVSSFNGYNCANGHASHKGVFGNMIGYNDDGTSEICGDSYSREDAEEIMDYSMPVHDEETGRVVSYGQLKTEEIVRPYLDDEQMKNPQDHLNSIPPAELDRLGKLGFEMAPFFSQEIHEKKAVTDHNQYHGSVEQMWVAQGVAGNATAAQHINESIGEIMTTRGVRDIDSNYREGLSRDQLFDKSFTSRRAAVAKTVNVAKPGYTARKLFYGLSGVTKQPGDCGSGDILRCKSQAGVCEGCSKNLGNSDDKYIGGFVSSNLSEPGTQLSMREFHSGGVGNTDASSVLNSTYDAWSSSPIIASASEKATTQDRRQAIYEGLKAEYAQHGVKMDDDNIKVVARQMTSFVKTKQGLKPVQNGEVADIVSMKSIGSSNNPLKSAAMESAYKRLSSESEFNLDNDDSANFLISL